MDDNNAFSEMAAALNNHQITDDEGKLEEETSIEEPASQETNTETETATAEKSAESKDTEPKTEDTDSETQLAEDESGKRYVPEGRFKEVYGKLKAYERGEIQPKVAPKAQQPISPAPVAPDKSSQLETELLYVTLPQFNPDSDQYDQVLDQTAVDIYIANPGITKLEAARKAIARAKALTKDQVKIIAEARSVKSQQADQGITSRVSNRPSDKDQVPGADATLEELEAYLRKTGEWNSKR